MGLLGPVRTAIDLGAFASNITSVLCKPPPWRAWCPIGDSGSVHRLAAGLTTKALLTPAVYTGPHSDWSGSRTHWLVNIWNVIAVFFTVGAYLWKPNDLNISRLTLWGPLGFGRVPCRRLALWKFCASCVLCDHVFAPWDVLSVSGSCVCVPSVINAALVPPGPKGR